MSRTEWGNVFAALQNEHRRRLLLSLSKRGPQDDRITNLERIYDGQSDYERFKTNMYHKHLPMLSDRGYVKWNQNDHEVACGQRFEEIEPVLDLIREREEDSLASPVRF